MDKPLDTLKDGQTEDKQKDDVSPEAQLNKWRLFEQTERKNNHRKSWEEEDDDEGQQSAKRCFRFGSGPSGPPSLHTPEASAVLSSSV